MESDTFKVGQLVKAFDFLGVVVSVDSEPFPVIVAFEDGALLRFTGGGVAKGLGWSHPELRVRSYDHDWIKRVTGQVMTLFPADCNWSALYEERKDS